MIKAIIFDIDGVLIDSFESNWKTFRNLLKYASYKKLPTKIDFKKVFHLTTRDALRQLTGGNSTEIERLVELLNNNSNFRVPFKVTHKSVNIIKQLTKRYKLAIVTSRIKTGVEHYFELAKTKPFFTTVVHFGHYTHPKPNPEPLLVACKRLKIKPTEAVYIGDAYTDIEAAKAAGMKVILYPKKRIPGADFYAKKFTEILKGIKAIDVD